MTSLPRARRFLLAAPKARPPAPAAAWSGAAVGGMVAELITGAPGSGVRPAPGPSRSGAGIPGYGTSARSVPFGVSSTEETSAKAGSGVPAAARSHGET